MTLRQPDDGAGQSRRRGQGGKDHWERIYRERALTEVSWHQHRPALSLSLIANAGLAPEAPIIDVGGGASLLVDHLWEAGFRHLAVLDIAAAALARARARLGKRAAAVEWYEADVTAFRPPHAFALWHDRAVFHFLTAAEQRRDYVECLRQALSPGGHLVIAAFAVGGPNRCSGLDIVQYDAGRLAAELGPGFDLCEQATECHLTPSGAGQDFGYYRFVRRC